MAWTPTVQASVVVETSPGNAHYWFFLDRAISAAEAKSLGERTRTSTGADHDTGNPAQPYRVAGTVNFPNAAKRARGRVITPTRVISVTDRLWTPTELIEAFPLPEPKTNGGGRHHDETGSHGSFDENDIPAELMALIRDGVEEPHRSDQFFGAVAALKRLGWTVAGITTLLEKYPNGIAAKFAGRVRAEVERAFGKVEVRDKRGKPLGTQDSELVKMNEKNAVLPIGGKTRVASWGYDPDFPNRYTIVRYASFGDFKALQDKYRHNHEGEDAKGNSKRVTVGRGTWWINHPGRRQYDGGMRFMPERDEEVVGDILNLWQGFAVAARKPDGKSGAVGCKLFLEHGLKIICSGDEEHFDYLIKREAFIAQRRTRSEVAVGLRTKAEGAGKGLWEVLLNHLLGQHAMQVHKPEHVTGKHNKHLEVMLRLTADEALFVGDPRHRNALFGLTTDPTVTIEPKFVDAHPARNYVNIDVISNATHFLPDVSPTARRYMAPTVSEERVGDLKYFKELNAQMKDERGAEALLYHLLHEIDLKDFNVRAVPKTAMLAEQAAYSRKGVDLLVEAACNEGRVPCSSEGDPGFSESSGYDDRKGFDYFIDHHADRDLSRLQALAVKRRLMDEWGCVTGKAARKQVGGVRRLGVLWPPLGELRDKFEAKHGEQIWSCAEVTEWEAPLLPF
jgi:RepB DNA-primase from phage plasmid